MMILVDSNVLIDVLTSDPVWETWSSGKLASLADRWELAINPLIFAEVALGYHAMEEVESALPASFVIRLPLPYRAAFLAGRAFREYRRRGGKRTSPLTDFYVGAHAQTEGHILLTRDAARYRTYFPDVSLIAPA